MASRNGESLPVTGCIFYCVYISMSIQYVRKNEKDKCEDIQPIAK